MVKSPRLSLAERYARYVAYFDRNEAYRTTHYLDFVRSYYDLTTDFYLRAWGESFHFAPLPAGASRSQALLHHQLQVLGHLQIGPGARLLDVGCGVGGPMLNLANAYGDCAFTGVNANQSQVERARRRIERAGLAGRCEAITADFMSLPFADRTFAGAYAFDATCHAPDRVALFAQVYRVLRPRGRFASCEWCLTERFSAADPRHRQLKRQIELSYGLPPLQTTRAVAAAFAGAGFDVIAADDLGDRVAVGSGAQPWFRQLTGHDRSFDSLLRRPWMREAATWAAAIGERLDLLEASTVATLTLLRTGTQALLAAGESGIFTPLFLLVGQRRG